jgi:peptidoglycan/LPS O-acetylase OafA/YrhL
MPRSKGGAYQRSQAISYQPHIDGLRALAVLPVILFHFDVPGFTGGFVGVDIFFAISGYLITGLIYSEVQRGNFCFRAFYARRLRRIYPALFVTLAATAAAGIMLLPPGRLAALTRSVIYATLGISNFLFWQESGYFDSDAIAKPLLHTWTLGVEEQFYLVWPATVLMLLWFKKKWALLGGLLAIGVAGLGFAEYGLNVDPAAAFYLMPFRAAEFVIGALLVWWPGSAIGNRVKEVCCAAGLLLIATAVFAYTPSTRFPGLAALLPCLGAAALIIGGSAPYLGFALVNPASVWLGRLSYSLYLVHWPMLSLLSQWEFGLVSPAQRVVLVAASIALAFLMFRFVEQPFRYGRPTLSPSRVIGIASASIALLICFSFSGLFLGERLAAHSFDAATVKSLKEKRFVIRQEICIAKGWDHCDDPMPGKINILIVGDSQAVDAYNALHVAMPDASVLLSTLGGCPPYDKMEELLPPTNPDRQKCLDLNVKRFDETFLKSFDAIVVDSLFGWYMPKHLEHFLARAKEVVPRTPLIVFGNYISLETECWEIVARLGATACGDAQFVASKFLFEDELAALAARYGATFISLKDLFCAREQCLVQISGVPFTWDKFHLSYEFEVEAGNRLRPVLSSIPRLKPKPGGPPDR